MSGGLVAPPAGRGGGTLRVAGAQSLNPDQLRFAAELIRLTHLAPETVVRWMLAEEPASRSPRDQGHNWLNVHAAPSGGSYSGVPLAGTSGGFARFRSADAAARETAYWINRMSNFAGIRKTAGKGSGSATVARQLAAIKRSPWDAGHYKNGFGGGSDSVFQAAGKAAGDVAGAAKDAATAPLKPLEAIAGLATSITSEPGYLGMWVGLMALGLGLAFVGANRLLGGKPAQAGGAVVKSVGMAAAA